MTDGRGVHGIRRLLVANRGEIAVRIVRACRDLGIEAVVAHSEADRESSAVRLADRAICIGAGPPAKSYLDGQRVLAAALGTGCSAVHPGYGFLAENAEFAAQCGAAGLTFVGPRPETIALLGDKIAARRTAQEIGIPVIEGSPAAVDDVAQALQLVGELGFPLLVKAGGGGGGKGLRRVDDADQLEQALSLAASEVLASSGNPALYLERFIERARHVEIQVAADSHGNVVSFGERDCSIQRSYQKLVEEAPSPVLDDATRKEMAAAAVALVAHAGYLGVGTVEFLFDQDARSFHFIEVNTRLQVEHPVTEIVTGHDLVTLQLAVAAGAELPVVQSEIATRGHAIEFRVNAEDPTTGFRPSVGRITSWTAPAGPGVRVDTHCHDGYLVPPYYDSLLAKVIVHGRTRDEALARARRALDEHRVEGVETTLDLHRWLLRQDDFTNADIDTGWIERCWPTRSDT